MTDTNSEAASKKPRRGRPRMMPDEWARILRRLYPDMTERNRQDRDYAGAAIRKLSAL
jgi:hypothetical protein